MNQQHQWSNASQARLQATPAGVERFRKDRLGVSVHFGLYSIDGQKEWHQCLEKIPRDVYARQLGRFNPHQFNAQEWIDEFVEAGATAFMVTTKHHDGFCLFDSELTDFTSTHAPFRRDLIAELAEACHRRKVALHLYYSLIDWHHPQMSSVHFEPAADFAAYCQYMLGQIEELCRNYGSIAGFLFDGWWPKAKATIDQDDIARQNDWPLTDLYDLIHTLQPQAMITNNHHVLPLAGEDYQVWEIDLPGENTQGFNCTQIGQKPLMAWMTATANGWSWQPERTDYRSAIEIKRYFEACRRMGATIFQNLGPMGDGKLNPVEVALLREVGPMLCTGPDAVAEGIEGSELAAIEDTHSLQGKPRRAARQPLAFEPEGIS